MSKSKSAQTRGQAKRYPQEENRRAQRIVSNSKRTFRGHKQRWIDVAPIGK